MPARRTLLPNLTVVHYLFATLKLARFYVVSTHFYLDMSKYMAGKERLPFQERVHPIALMWPINHSAFFMHSFERKALLQAAAPVSTPLADSPATGAFYIVSFVSLLVAGLFSVLL